MTATSLLRKLGPTLCLITGVAAFGSGFAQAAGGLEIHNAVFQEVVVAGPDGSTTTRLVPASKVVPGGHVVYEITYRNTGRDGASNITINNPLPDGLVYVDGKGTPVSAVSVDGGANYGRLPDLVVIGADGNPRAAQASDVTHLRWVVPPLDAGGVAKVTFEAVVK
jgi:uncharacterized repeat protein (TIGR01451 family)